MIYATKIKMRPGCYNSQSLLEIDSIYLAGCSVPGFYKKAAVYDFLKENPGQIKVNVWPNPDVVPVMSVRGEKYVRSTPNGYMHDNLLDLPRE